MVTFQFSSLASAARLGLISMTVVVVAAGIARAGGPKFSMGNGGGSSRNFSGGKSGFSLGGKSGMSLGNSLGSKSFSNKSFSLSNNFKTMNLGGSQSTSRYTPKFGTSNGLGNLSVKPGTTINRKINALGDVVTKNNPGLTINHRISGLSDLVNKNGNGVIGRKIPGLTDVVKKDTTINRKIEGLDKLLNKPTLINSEAGRRIADAIKAKGKGGDDGKDGGHEGRKGNGKGKIFCHPDWKFGCFKPCPWWYSWNYPRWCPLYRYGCGYWYDVPVVVIREGVDLQLLAVRMLDSGDAETVGPAFRVWIRNNSPVVVARPFNVVLVAGRASQATSDLPQTGVRVDSIPPGQVLPLDIRLPVAANQPGLPMLHVIVDSHREIVEVHEDNNGAVIARAEILPLDATEVAATVPAGF